MQLVATGTLKKTRSPLDRAEIIEKWDLGIYSHLAYVDAALAYDGFTDIDIEDFIDRWSGVPDPDTGRVKRLSKRHLLAAIATLDEKGVIKLKNTQLTIDFEGWRSKRDGEKNAAN